MLGEFKTFIMRGNVVDLAVGVIIGASFGAIVTSLVNDVLMPPIGRLLGGVDFKDFFVSLSGQAYPTLAAAKAAGAPTLNYGVFLNALINFLIVSSAVFLLVQQVNRLFPKPAAPAPAPTKECSWCASAIPVAAKRCPRCTSNLAGV
ncbi:MAG TPA: large conductance mechanosensitive channel protein MscL [Candidatus Binatia bacterium]|nr:large conductance mechanosensitive channel protein MscL [Candidatus Binatia bacterium]